MKKLLTLIITLSVFQMAQARPVMLPLLNYEFINKSTKTAEHKLTVYASGAVTHETKKVGEPSELEVVAMLRAGQVETLAFLIRRSTPAIFGFEVSPVMCFAPSSHVEKYTASNKTVLLRQGAMCDGGYDINKRPAALKLVRILKILENAAHRKLAFADVDEQVEQILNIQ